MISIDQALDRLLHRRSYLEAFLAGRVNELDVSEDDLQALLTIDPIQLRKTAERVRTEVLQRKHRGSGGLTDLYARTIEAWKVAHPDDQQLEELLSLFLESPAFESYRETSLGGPGICLEAAFFRFCETQRIGDGAILEEEFLGAMMKALVVSPRPDFLLPAEIRSVSQGFFAVSKRGEPTLYAAVRGNFVIGSITPFIADLLLLAEEPRDIAQKHGVSVAVLQATLEHLAGIGLTSL